MAGRYENRVFVEQQTTDYALPTDKLEAIKVLALMDIVEALETSNELNSVQPVQETLTPTQQEIRARMEADPNYIPMVAVNTKKTKSKKSSGKKVTTTEGTLELPEGEPSINEMLGETFTKDNPEAPVEDKPKYTGVDQAKT